MEIVRLGSALRIRGSSGAVGKSRQLALALACAVVPRLRQWTLDKASTDADIEALQQSLDEWQDPALRSDSESAQLTEEREGLEQGLLRLNAELRHLDARPWPWGRPAWMLIWGGKWRTERDGVSQRIAGTKARLDEIRQRFQSQRDGLSQRLEEAKARRDALEDMPRVVEGLRMLDYVLVPTSIPFAERIAIPERNLILLPAGMDPARAALTEPCATAWHAVALAARAAYRPLAENAALVIGGGSVGLLGALILKAQGCRRVILAETNALRRETARQAGLAVVDPISAPPEADSFDLVLDAVGGARTRSAAVEAVRPGGVIAHVGLMDSDGPFDVRTLTLSEVTFIGVYTYGEADLRASLDALHRGALGSLEWVEERPLAEGAVAFADLDAGNTAAAKIVLRP